jgi:hypothetical protein
MSVLELLTSDSVNGRKRRYPLTLNPFKDSIFVLKLLAMEVPMSSIYNRKLDAEFKSRDEDLVLWSMALGKRVTRICICTLRKYQRRLCDSNH